jgi:GTP cyclohydrolase I
VSNSEERIKEFVKELVAAYDDDPNRPGIERTPERVAETYKKILGGYERSLEEEVTYFDNAYKYDDLIYSGKIDFFSLCEHHLLPFYGEAHIAYIPNQKIIGLSKLARAVDIYARRLQEQERLTMQIATKLEALVDAKGVIVMLEGKHFCNMARGVEKVNSNMKTVVARGCFKENDQLYNRFFNLISSSSN